MFETHAPKILIVEDNTSNHPLFTTAFEAAGFSVTIVPYIDEGFLQDVAGIRPDIISMDIMIANPENSDPDHDGLSALALLKNDERTREIPVLILTNFFEESKVEKAKATGAVDFINLQGHSISTIPAIFRRYLNSPKDYKPVHPEFREG